MTATGPRRTGTSRPRRSGNPQQDRAERGAVAKAAADDLLKVQAEQGTPAAQAAFASTLTGILGGQPADEAAAQAAAAQAPAEPQAPAEAPAAEVDQAAQDIAATTGTAPAKATWLGHGQPQQVTYHGRKPIPSPEGQQVTAIQRDRNTLHLMGPDGTQVDEMGVTAKWWAITPRMDGTQGSTPAQAPKAAKTPKAPKAPSPKRAEGIAAWQPKAPQGYTVVWPHPSYALIRNTQAPEGSSTWLVMCTHGKTSPVLNAREGDSKGTKTSRATWCPKCKADQAKAQAKADAKDAAADATAEHDSAQASK